MSHKNTAAAGFFITEVNRSQIMAHANGGKAQADSADIVPMKKLVRKGGLEPPRFYPPDPKSGASANSATLASLKVSYSID
jgi:hypothetical protein